MATTNAVHAPEEPGSNPESRLRNKMNGSPLLHYTAGFTIPNILDKLPASNSTDIDLIGWMILFPKTGPETEMRKIEIKKLWKSTSGGFSVLFTADFISADTIIPHICRQVPRTSSSQHTIGYFPALTLTQTVFTPQLTGLLMGDLSHHRTWAEASFIRRTDLDLLRDYLNPANQNGYDDVFFSGAEVKYSTMHNPRLRVQQHNYPSPPPIYDTGHAFTLKAEPFNAAAVAPVPPPTPLPKPPIPSATAAAATGQPSGSSLVSTASAPGAFLMIPCPDFWEVSQGIAKEMAAGDFWFGKSLVTTVQERLSPTAVTQLLRTRNNVNTVESSIVQEVVNFIRTNFGNTPA